MLTLNPRKLNKVLRDLNPLAERATAIGFLTNAKDVELLTGLADDIHEAMMEYKVCTSTTAA